MREFGVGERVWVHQYGYGLVREAIGNKEGTNYVRIIFDNDPDNWACWLFTAERVLKESEVGRAPLQWWVVKKESEVSRDNVTVTT